MTVTGGSLSAGFELPGAAFALITHGRLAAAKVQKSEAGQEQQGDLQPVASWPPGTMWSTPPTASACSRVSTSWRCTASPRTTSRCSYAKNDTLYVPVTQLDMVSKYIGPREDAAVKLNRLGGTEWQKAKTRVRTAVKDIAKELIQLYAQRMQAEGLRLPPGRGVAAGL